MGALGDVTRRRKLRGFGIALLLVAVLIALPPLLDWQRLNEQRTLSLSNLRRLTLALQLYAQDYDGCLPVPAERQTDGQWLTWPDRIKGYTQLSSIRENPSNPISALHTTVMEPDLHIPVHTCYALNHRFNSQFSRGPFHLENLEMSNQTAMLVEAGPMWNVTGRDGQSDPHPAPYARLDYGDTLNRYRGLVAYPSTHGGRIAVSAADGHAASLRVEHYLPADGPHDPLYGRIGGDIYNWNGGHPNGELDHPAHE
jgi:type II secretory pathway pseudopilin PulG